MTFDLITKSENQQEKLYVSGSFLLMLLPILDEHCINRREFFAQEGVDYKLLDDVHYRVSKTASQNLWQHLYNVTLDPLIGIKAGRLANPKILSILGSSMQLTDTPLEGLKVLIRFFRIYCNVVESVFIKVSDGYCLRIKASESEEIEAIDVDAFCSALITICRQHYGEGFSPSSINLFKKHLSDYSYHERFFRCPITLNSNKFEIYFSNDSLNLSSNHTNYQHNALYNKSRLKALEGELKLLDGEDLVEQVRILIKQNLTTVDLNIGFIAKRLNFTERTLQRRLSDQKTQFRAIVEECRYEVGLDYIKLVDLSLTDVSHLLGFSNYNNFARAFKRWTNMSPNKFRQINCHSNESQSLN